ncbi:MarR family winged helix-turn-helix transcriptional regulator [Beijerinckia indica]|uniref:Transcriptional regulator, MarR family n=1 Tax=Beijerinckia indica subsp. indica (strain ATCC 9039 / DSM 1715 / NCIMB 8712) TaxID=395963 RepID=B2IBS1_BEII9|nr:MarR family winged helix-turn-helix transcriptional regulator [Beijerinckia indica]ACB93793.1 transcriptional regulator, MarR family [Beijerinckia indica subsp. indica ATCC 9039]
MSAKRNGARLRQHYTFTLLQAARAWRRYANVVVETYGLSEATALALIYIGRSKEAPRQSELASTLGIEGPTLVRLLDQLCALGLVVRREDPGDRRAKVLGLTDAGRDSVMAIEDELDVLRGSVLEKVSMADLETSLRVFTAILDHTSRIDVHQEIEA